jgi:hypothetical protein
MTGRQFSVQSGGSTITPAAVPQATRERGGRWRAQYPYASRSKVAQTTSRAAQRLRQPAQGNAAAARQSLLFGTLNFFNSDSAAGGLMTHADTE